MPIRKTPPRSQETSPKPTFIVGLFYTPSEGVAFPRHFPTPSEGVVELNFVGEETNMLSRWGVGCLLFNVML